MKISCNDDYLFTIGEDGLLVIYEVYDKEGDKFFRLKNKFNSSKQKRKRRIRSRIRRRFPNKQR